MAIYHLSVKNGVNESSGGTRGANHHAYINREDKYKNREDLETKHSGNLPNWAIDAKHFWASADRYERKNGRVYKELEISLPRELNEEQREKLVKEFIEQHFGTSYTYSYAIHNPLASDGEHNPHVHIMFCERKLDGIDRTEQQHFKRYNADCPEKGGAQKDRFFNARNYVYQVRFEWANHVNDFCEKLGIDARIDHRSYKDQGIDLTSQNFRAEYISDHSYSINENIKEVRRQNGETIIECPSEAIKALTANQSVFTASELERFLASHTDGEEQYLKAYEAVLKSPECELLFDENEVVFSSKELIDLEHSISVLIYNANDDSRRVKPIDLTDTLPINAMNVIADRTFNDEQHRAFLTLTSTDRVSVLNGSAGTGKSYVLSGVADAFTASGYEVHGIALQAITANAIAEDCGVPSSTIASFLARYESGNLEIHDKSVLILDEAGMVGSRDLQKLLLICEKHGAQIKMVGDSYQLSAVMAGSAFKFVQDQLDGKNQAELVDIQRQKHATHAEKMTQASQSLAKHDVSTAMDIYQSLGNVHTHDDHASAVMRVVDDWMNDQSQDKLMLAHSNKDVNDLNLVARSRLIKDGQLDDENFDIQTHQGILNIRAGEKIVFKKNDKSLNVTNGEVATVIGFTQNHLGEVDRIVFEKGNNDLVSIDVKAYNHFKYGYANTIHASQGMTVDSTHVLCSEHMNANLAYVAMTRHKHKLNIHYKTEDFATNEQVAVKNKDGSLSIDHNNEPVMRDVSAYEKFIQTLSRSETKKFSTDYTVVEEKEKLIKSYLNDHRLHIKDKAYLYGVNRDFERLTGEQKIYSRDEIVSEVRAHLKSKALIGKELVKRGDMCIAQGEKIKLTEAVEFKTGWFKSERLSKDTELQVLDAYTVKDKGYLEVRCHNTDYKIPFDKVKFDYPDRYFNEYKNETQARFDARNNSEVYARMRASLNQQKTDSPKQNFNDPISTMRHHEQYIHKQNAPKRGMRW